MFLGIDIAALSLLAIVVPFVGALAMTMLDMRYAKWICVACGGFSLLCTLGVWGGVAANGGEAISWTIASLGHAVILSFIFDKMSVLLASCFVGIGFLISIYSMGYMSKLNREHPDVPARRFYAFFTVFIGAMAGLVYSDTLIAQLIFFEITGACSFALIGYYDTEIARKSAMKALILTHIGAIGLYVASGLLFAWQGTFQIEAIAQLADPAKIGILCCIVWAAWAKSAQLPLYMWLPSAMNAPTPVSAYLHGASMVKVGVAVLARALMSAGVIPEPVGWVLVIGAVATLVFSFLEYLPQTDMKRLLAFSTISQLSYIFLGFGFFVFGSQLAFDGGVMHIFNHAFTKTLFFLVAGAFSYAAGTRMLPKLRGVLKKSPLLAVAFAIAGLGIAGAPPMAPFFSKIPILAGSFQTAFDTGNPVLIVIVCIALAETVGCFAWFLHWIGRVLPGEPSEEIAEMQPLPTCMSGVLVVLIVLVFAAGFIGSAWLG